MEPLEFESLFQEVFRHGKPTYEIPSVIYIAAYCKEHFIKLNREHKRFDNLCIYKVGISEKLLNLRKTLIKNLKD